MKQLLIMAIAIAIAGSMFAQKNRRSEYWIVPTDGDTIFCKELKCGNTKIKGESVEGKEISYKFDDMRICRVKEGKESFIYAMLPFNAEKPNKGLQLMKAIKEKGNYRYYDLDNMGAHVYYLYDGDKFITEVGRKNKKEVMMKYFGEK